MTGKGLSWCAYFPIGTQAMTREPDIVGRLRGHPGPALTVTEQFRIMVEQRHDAAAEIERLIKELEIWKRNGGDILLRAEIERLRAALQTFAKCFGPLEDNHMLSDECRNCFALARAALEPKP